MSPLFWIVTLGTEGKGALDFLNTSKPTMRLLDDRVADLWIG